MEQPKNNLKIVTDKKTNARVILPNMLTLIGVCIGLSSIRFALDGNLIEDKPIQTPIRVSMLGKITLALVFLSVTIFKLFFGCSIN